MPTTLRTAGIALLALGGIAAGTAPAQPQYDPNYAPPRTPWGDPAPESPYSPGFQRGSGISKPTGVPQVLR